jgi:hypothetical protein
VFLVQGVSPPPPPSGAPRSSRLLPVGPLSRKPHSASLISGPAEGCRRMEVASRKANSSLCSSNSPLQGSMGRIKERCEAPCTSAMPG